MSIHLVQLKDTMTSPFRSIKTLLLSVCNEWRICQQWCIRTSPSKPNVQRKPGFQNLNRVERFAFFYQKIIADHRCSKAGIHFAEPLQRGYESVYASFCGFQRPSERLQSQPLFCLLIFPPMWCALRAQESVTMEARARSIPIKPKADPKAKAKAKAKVKAKAKASAKADPSPKAAPKRNARG